jgi:hypothetical protein
MIGILMKGKGTNLLKSQRMKIWFALFLVLIATTMVGQPGQDSIPADKKDVGSVDAIVGALYNVISGPAGEKRNWARMRTLFIPEARMIPTAAKPGSLGVKKVLSLEEYIRTSGSFLEKNGFYENEIGRKTERYGQIVHVFSTYESRNKQDDPKPFMRGINSIQLWYDGTRWWIVNVMWENESTGNPIPDQYLQRLNE